MRILIVVAILGCGHSGSGTMSDASGSGGDGSDPDALPDGPPNVMFTTSMTYSAALGGLDGADQKCADRATAAHLAGTFLAYLSTSTVNAKDRFGAARGWVRTDTKPFAQALGGEIFYPPRLDEFGNDLVASPAEVFTGTDGVGVAVPGKTCADFTSATGSVEVGTPTTGSPFFSDGGSGPCSTARRLYCFGIGATVHVAPPPPTGRRAFIAYFSPSAGRAAADAACQAAGAAVSSGSFKALLGTTTSTAASRFSATGSNWVRHDGVEVATSPQALLGGTLIAPIEYEATGAYATDSQGYVVTGGPPNATPGAADTCTNWSSMAVDNSMRAGTPMYSTDWAFSRTALLCDNGSTATYCLEE